MRAISTIFTVISLAIVSIASRPTFAEENEKYNIANIKESVGRVIEQALAGGAFAHDIQYFGIVHFEPFGSSAKIYSEAFVTGPNQEPTEIIREIEALEPVGVVGETVVDGQKWLTIVDTEGNFGFIRKPAVKTLVEAHPTVEGKVYGKVNLRSEARIQYPIVTRALKGELLVVLYEVTNDLDQAWLRIETQYGERAWILKQLTRNYMEIPAPGQEVDWGIPSQSETIR